MSVHRPQCVSRARGAVCEVTRRSCLGSCVRLDQCEQTLCPCPACFFPCVLILSFPLRFFLAAAHRRDDPKTLSCQDRAVPSGTSLGSGRGRSRGVGRWLRVTKWVPTCFSWSLEQRPGHGVESSSAGHPAGFLLKRGARHTCWAPFSCSTYKSSWI